AVVARDVERGRRGERADGAADQRADGAERRFAEEPGRFRRVRPSGSRVIAGPLTDGAQCVRGRGVGCGGAGSAGKREVWRQRSRCELRAGRRLDGAQQQQAEGRTAGCRGRHRACSGGGQQSGRASSTGRLHSGGIGGQSRGERACGTMGVTESPTLRRLGVRHLPLPLPRWRAQRNRRPIPARTPFPPSLHMTTFASMTEQTTTNTIREPERLILLRLAAELAIKSRRTRTGFQRRLLANIRDALRSTGAPFRVEGTWGRVWVRTASAEAQTVLSRVFGVSSLSPVDVVVPANMDAIVSAGEAAFRERVQGKTFAVRARRTGRHPFSSHDIQVQLGAALNRYAEVDLDEPDVTVYVEVRDGEAYLFTDWIPGAGGLPV